MNTKSLEFSAGRGTAAGAFYSAAAIEFAVVGKTPLNGKREDGARAVTCSRRGAPGTPLIGPNRQRAFRGLALIGGYR